MNERGSALLAALAVALILLPVGGFVVLQCRTDFMIEQNLRADVEAFYVAEAGLEHAVAEIEPGAAFDDLLAGPDHAMGTADDGVFPFAGGSPGDFPAAPLRYDVRVAATRGGVDIVSSATGWQGAAKTVSATVIRAEVPFTAAALVSATDIARIDVGRSGFVLSGQDHGHGNAAPLPGLSGARADGEAWLRAHASGDTAAQFAGAGGAPSVGTNTTFDPRRTATAAAAAAAAVSIASGAAAAGLALGTAASPQVSVVHGDFDVGDTCSGAGVLIVQGALHISGRFAFDGVVLAMGPVLFDSSSEVSISGALWQTASADDRLQLCGHGSIAYDSDALASVDRTFSGLLPHAAVVRGWQESL